MVNIVQKYLGLNKFSHLNNEFENLYLSHPNYPSLFALTDTLDLLNVENVVAKVDKNQILELPDVFLALINSNNEEEIVLISKQEKNIKVETNKSKISLYTYEDFDEIWYGVVVAIEPNENEIKKDAINNKSQKMNYIFVALFLFAILSFFNFSIGFSYFPYLICSYFGILISYFIIQDKFGIENEIVSKICKGFNTECDTVINSDDKYSNKYFNFADLPIIFFTTCFITLIFQPTQFYYVGLLSFLSIPVLIYSIYSQKFVIKKWCALCLIVSTLIVVQFAFFIFKFKNSIFSFHENPFFISIFFLVTTVIWFSVKPFIEGKIKADSEIKKLTRFKRSFDVFNNLVKEVFSSSSFDNFDGILIGKKEAKIQLTLFLSPSCSPCHDEFKNAYNLYLKFPERLKLNVFFNINIENNDNPYQIVVKTLYQINSNDNQKAIEALCDWHINKIGLGKWMQKWKTETISDWVDSKIQEQYSWCLQNELNYTPVKIVNNKLFPKEYETSELSYFFNDIDEEATSETPLVAETIY